MTADFSWNRALRVAGINLTNEERAAGWPAALTPENLARLQFPCGGSGLEKREAAGNQRDLIAAISKAVQGGALPAVERTRTEDITEPRQVPDFYPPRSPHSGGLGSSEWRSRDLPRPMRTVTKKVGERTIPFFVIEREAFRDWLANQGLEPSEHVRAWIDSTEVKAASRPASKPKGQDSPDARLESILVKLEKIAAERAEEGHQGEAEGAKVKRKTKGDLVEDWLCACESRAQELGETFERSQMPGTKAEFLELLRALDPEFKSMNEVSSLERYLKGLCTWPGGRPTSARPLYARLFPESRILNPGAVLPLRKKS